MFKTLSTVMVADHLYVQLRVAFPKVRFLVSVAPDSDVIDVSWMDGPEECEVQDIADELTSEAGEITIDQRGLEHTGRSAARGIFLDRFFTSETLAEAGRLWTEQTGIEVDTKTGWGVQRPQITVQKRVIPADTLGCQISQIAALVVERHRAHADQ